MKIKHVLVAWAGTFLVLLTAWLMFSANDLVYAFASLGGSAVIVFGMPGSLMSQPRSLFGGHAVGALTGCLFLPLFGRGPFAIAAAVATALAIMQLTRTIHSPAGADPIIVMMSSLSAPTALVELAAGLLLLWLAGVVLLNWAGICRYGHEAPIFGPLARRIADRGQADGPVADAAKAARQTADER